MREPIENMPSWDALSQILLKHISVRYVEKIPAKNSLCFAQN